MKPRWLWVCVLLIGFLSISAHAQDNYSEALRRIQAAADQQATELDLSNLRLVELPPELWQLTQLHILNLSDGRFGRLPADIGRLTNLQTLDLGNGYAWEADFEHYLPPEIGLLTQLHTLNVSYNGIINHLPPEIGNLTQLQTLHLTSTEIAEIPPEIGRLTNLIHLDLSGTKIHALPSEIGELVQLERLYLKDSEITTLPAEIGRLTKLPSLDLSNTPLIELPPEIGQLSSLKTLTLNSTFITQLPAEIGQLTTLEHLSIENTPLVELPPEIGQLSKLETLYLKDTLLTELPPEIGQLSSLNTLELWGAPLQSLPPEIAQLSVLVFLNLSETALTSVPPEIGQLTALAKLDLSETGLTSLPAEIGQLRNLYELSLYKTPITSLPHEFGQLTHLHRLDLSGTQLTEIPPEIYQLTGLGTLLVYDMPLSEMPRELLLIPDLNLLYDRTVHPERIHIMWLWYRTNYEQLDALELMVVDFNNSQTEIELELLCACFSATPMDFLARMSAADDPPDIVGPMSYNEINPWEGYWLDLQPLADASGYDLSQFSPQLLDSFRTPDGLFGLPHIVYPGVLYYNADLFDEAGLNYPPTTARAPYIMPDGTAVPWDYNTVAQIGSLLTLDANGHTATSPDFDPGQIVQFGFVHQWDSLRSDFQTFGGASLLDENGQVILTEAWREQALWHWEGIWKTHFIPTEQHLQSELLGYNNAFASGHVAMARSMSWYTCCMEELSARWDIAVQPAYEGVIYAPNDWEAFLIQKDSKHPTEALIVLQHMLETIPTVVPFDEGVFPARTDLQAAALTGFSQQYPTVQNWDVLSASISLAPTPHHDSGYPNYTAGQQRFAEFLTLLRGENGANIDLDAELDRLQADLQVIVDAEDMP